MTAQSVTVLEYNSIHESPVVEVYSTDNKAQHRIIELAATFFDEGITFPLRATLTERAQYAARRLRDCDWTVHITRQRVR